MAVTRQPTGRGCYVPGAVRVVFEGEAVNGFELAVLLTPLATPVNTTQLGGPV